jgi:hypothetical protein
MSTQPPPPLPAADAARIIASGGLTLGALFITAFTFVVREVGLKQLAADPGHTLVGLMPAAAALAFIASGRALAALYTASVPMEPGSKAGHVQGRMADIGGAYGIFALVLSGLIGVSSAFAVAVVLPTLSTLVVTASAVAGGAAFVIGFAGMMLRSTATQRVLDAALLVMIVGAGVLSVVLG